LLEDSTFINGGGDGNADDDDDDDNARDDDVDGRTNDAAVSGLFCHPGTNVPDQVQSVVLCLGGPSGGKLTEVHKIKKALLMLTENQVDRPEKSTSLISEFRTEGLASMIFPDFSPTV
jgi:hypothetical protein